jgi:uncharacterized membrane protein
MLILLYFTEGIVRATTETGTGQWLAIVETALSLIFFCASVGYARLSRPDFGALTPLPRRGGEVRESLTRLSW